MTTGAPRQYQAPCDACALLAAALPVGDAATSCVFQLAAHDRASDGQPCDGGGRYVPRHLVWDAELRAWLASQHATSGVDAGAVVNAVTVYVTGRPARCAAAAPGTGILYTVTASRAPDGWAYSVASAAGGAEVGRVPLSADASTIAGILADVVRFALRTRGPR